MKPKTKTCIRVVLLSDDLNQMLNKLHSEQSRFLSKKGLSNKYNQVFYGYQDDIPSNSTLNKYLN